MQRRSSIPGLSHIHSTYQCICSTSAIVRYRLSERAAKRLLHMSSSVALNNVYIDCALSSYYLALLPECPGACAATDGSVVVADDRRD
jgi:hypothetical protein